MDWLLLGSVMWLGKYISIGKLRFESCRCFIHCACPGEAVVFKPREEITFILTFLSLERQLTYKESRSCVHSRRNEPGRLFFPSFFFFFGLGGGALGALTLMDSKLWPIFIFHSFPRTNVLWLLYLVDILLLKKSFVSYISFPKQLHSTFLCSTFQTYCLFIMWINYTKMAKLAMTMWVPFHVAYTFLFLSL